MYLSCRILYFLVKSSSQRFFDRYIDASQISLIISLLSCDMSAFSYEENQSLRLASILILLLKFKASEIMNSSFSQIFVIQADLNESLHIFYDVSSTICYFWWEHVHWWSSRSATHTNVCHEVEVTLFNYTTISASSARSSSLTVHDEIL